MRRLLLMMRGVVSDRPAASGRCAVSLTALLYTDVAAMKADVAACQRAFAASKDPRDSYQACIILGEAATAGTFQLGAMA